MKWATERGKQKNLEAYECVDLDKTLSHAEVFAKKAAKTTNRFTQSHASSLGATRKSVSMRKPGRTRQEVIQLKSPILLNLGINVGFGEQMIMAKTSFILFKLGGPPPKMALCHCFMHI